jgi:predicted short-subunit dehydrogenase-like oxidoreductase (DUF2520 family)
MFKISIIGSGNLAKHLITYLKAIESMETIELVSIFARNPHNLYGCVTSDIIVSDYKLLKPADVYIIAVSDDAIAEVSSNFKNQFLVHTSGALPITVLNPENRRGVWYPLQSFSKNKTIDFEEVPFCIEAENTSDLLLLNTLAGLFSEKIFHINSFQRKQLHLAAVFVNNFVNHLYLIGNEVCDDNQIPFEILKPLIAETANKINHISPNEAQTGPAIRYDELTIQMHKSLLKSENHLKIYQTLTQSIQNHGKKL